MPDAPELDHHPLNDDQPDRGKLSPGLRRWLESAGTEATVREGAQGGAPEEHRTVVVRPRRSADAAEAARRLAAAAEAAGARVESAGPGAITLIVTPAALARVSHLNDVATVDEPRRLGPKGLGGGTGPL